MDPGAGPHQPRVPEHQRAGALHDPGPSSGHADGCVGRALRGLTCVQSFLLKNVIIVILLFTECLPYFELKEMD